jgi:hypothetical protein
MWTLFLFVDRRVSSIDVNGMAMATVSPMNDDAVDATSNDVCRAMSMFLTNVNVHWMDVSTFSMTKHRLPTTSRIDRTSDSARHRLLVIVDVLDRCLSMSNVAFSCQAKCSTTMDDATISRCSTSLVDVPVDESETLNESIVLRLRHSRTSQVLWPRVLVWPRRFVA